MTRNRKAILVTGSHRSGTTWAGKILATAPGTAYIHEPFNMVNKIGLIAYPFTYWFQYICEENAHQYKETLQKVITYNYPLRHNLTKARTPRDLAKIARDQGKTLLHKTRNDTPIIKDPIAFLSVEWLTNTFDMSVLIMIRHPAAFCSSLKMKDWQFDFNHFLQQPLLIQGKLKKFEAEIKEQAANKQDIITQGILLWNCFHYLIHTYQEKYPEWLFVRHEDLSTDPVTNFRSIYNAFDLEFTPEVEAAILTSSSTHNPTEQQTGNEFLRNSEENIHNWKKRLTETEIQKIKKSTFEISTLFYTEHEW